jgi:hypothetical protein
MKKLVLLFLLVCATVLADGIQIDALLSGMRDDSGAPLAGGKVFTYLAGTTTLTPLYRDRSLVTRHQNPITLDAAGRVLAFGSGRYKFIIKDSSGVTVFTADNVAYNSVLPTSGTIYDPLGSSWYQTFLTASSASIQKANIASLTVTDITLSNLEIASASIPGLVSNNATFTGLVAVKTPTVASSAANKAYVDAGDAAVTVYVNAAGATMTAYVDAACATVTAYVNAACATVTAYVDASGATLTAYIDALASYASELPAVAPELFPIHDIGVDIPIATYTLASQAMFWFYCELVGSQTNSIDAVVIASSSDIVVDYDIVRTATSSELISQYARSVVHGIASGQVVIYVNASYPIEVYTHGRFKYLYIRE